MRRLTRIPKTELLQALKDCLRDLENARMFSPDDLGILEQKRNLRLRIEELECDEDDLAA